MKEIPNNVFKSLLKRVKVDISEPLYIDFEAEYGKYEISFFAMAQQDFKVETEDFGYMERGEWIQCVPTDKQIEKLQKIVDEKKSLCSEYVELEHYTNDDYPERNDNYFNDNLR